MDIRPFSRQPVCPVDRHQQRRRAGLLLSAMCAVDIDRQLRAPCCGRVAGAVLQKPVPSSNLRAASR